MIALVSWVLKAITDDGQREKSSSSKAEGGQSTWSLGRLCDRHGECSNRAIPIKWIVEMECVVPYLILDEWTLLSILKQSKVSV
jgi:hypothetical protein